jgi:NAD(P)-dependent dehydrogenase (short-subunit alcohol dehydrogenase family)
MATIVFGPYRVQEIAMHNRLDSKNVLVTGGNSGIGRAIATRFVKEGANVTFTGRDQSTIDQVAADLGDRGQGIRADVADLKSNTEIVERAVARFGKLDVFVANAGVAEVVPFLETDEALYDKIMDINLKGLFFGIQAAVRQMNDGGSIVLVGSVVSVKGFGGYSAYSASKGGVRTLARVLASELAERNIRVNVVSPGPIDTPIMARQGLDQAFVEENFVPMVPLKRLGEADEIANTALFLASDESSYITGADLMVDGGVGQV